MRCRGHRGCSAACIGHCRVLCNNFVVRVENFEFFRDKVHFLVFLSARDIPAVFCLHRICMRDGVYFRSLNLPKGFVLCRYRIILSIVVENRTSRKSRGKVIPAAALLLPKPRPFLPDRLAGISAPRSGKSAPALRGNADHPTSIANSRIIYPFLALIAALQLRPRSVRFHCTKYHILIASFKHLQISAQFGTICSGISRVQHQPVLFAGRKGPAKVPGKIWSLESCTSSRPCL